MGRRVRVDVPGGVYHVTARGNEKKAIYRDDEDRHDYIDRLIECRNRLKFRIFAFCLMGNHVHLALERGPVELSRIMLTLHSAYAQRFNRRHERVGHLFQGRYTAFLVEKEAYLVTLVRYIHMNPLKAGLARRPEDYRWSSDRHYRARESPLWLDRDTVLGMLGTRRAFAVAAYRQLMATNGNEYEDATRSMGITGSDEFVKRVLGERHSKLARDPEIRDWTIQRIAACAAKTAGLTVSQLQARGQRSTPARQRAITAYVAQNYARIALSKTARFFNRDDSTLVHAVRRLEEALQCDPSAAQGVRSVVSVLESS